MAYLGPQYQPAPPPTVVPQEHPNTRPLPNPPTPAEQAAHVRAILASMPETQKEEFFKCLDNEGF